MQTHEIRNPTHAVDHRHVPVRVMVDQLNDPYISGAVDEIRVDHDFEKADRLEAGAVVLHGNMSNQPNPIRLDRAPLIVARMVPASR